MTAPTNIGNITVKLNVAPEIDRAIQPHLDRRAAVLFPKHDLDGGQTQILRDKWVRSMTYLLERKLNLVRVGPA